EVHMMKTRLLWLIVLLVITAPSAMSQSSGGVASGKTPHPVIKNKPEPDWPKSIKKKSDLVIVLRCVFTSKATVTNIHFVETQPANPDDYSAEEIDDLVKRASDAAQQIRFVPATKDGKAVSMWMELQYQFNVHSSGS